MIQVSIPGEPVAKGRPRFSNGHAYTPKKTRQWEKQAKKYAIIAMIGKPILVGAVMVHVIATFNLPPSWPKWKQEAALDDKLFHTAKPDGDNVLKAAKDAMNGIVYADDAQVFSTLVTKRYGTIPGVHINIEPVDGLTTQDKRKPA